jgi:hypothetical protein
MMDEGWTHHYVLFFKMWAILDERSQIVAWTASEHIAEDICKYANESRGVGTSDLYIG